MTLDLWPNLCGLYVTRFICSVVTHHCLVNYLHLFEAIHCMAILVTYQHFETVPISQIVTYSPDSSKLFEGCASALSEN